LQTKKNKTKTLTKPSESDDGGATVTADVEMGPTWRGAPRGSDFDGGIVASLDELDEATAEVLDLLGFDGPFAIFPLRLAAAHSALHAREQSVGFLAVTRAPAAAGDGGSGGRGGGSHDGPRRGYPGSDAYDDDDDDDVDSDGGYGGGNGGGGYGNSNVRRSGAGGGRGGISALLSGGGGGDDDDEGTGAVGGTHPLSARDVTLIACLAERISGRLSTYAARWNALRINFSQVHTRAILRSDAASYGVRDASFFYVAFFF
jgi:hypothetical protein